MKEIKEIIKRHYWFIIPGLIAGMVFFNSLKAGFFWDDRLLILDNPNVKTWSRSIGMFSPDYWQNKHSFRNQYRPLRNLSFTFDYSFWHTDPFGYHLTNTTLHLINTLLVSILCFYIFRSKTVGLLAGILFAVHPAHIESINYIKNRSDLLCSMFFMLSFIFWIKDKKMLSLAGYILSVTAKELGIVLPFILLVYVLFFEPENEKMKKIKGLVPYFFIAVFFIFWNFVVLSSDKKPDNIVSDIDNVNFARLVLSTLTAYIFLLFAPIKLCVDRVLPIIPSLFSLKAIVFYVFSAFAVYIFRGIKGSKKYYFSILWILIALGPISNIIPLKGRPFAEQRLYLPSIGWAMLAGLVFSSLIKDVRFRKISIAVFVGITVMWSAMVIKRNFVWYDEELLWKTAAQENPGNQRAWLGLAGNKLRKGKIKESKDLYMKIIGLIDKNSLDDVYMNLGVISQKEGDINKALEYFAKAKDIDPQNYELWSNMGAMYLMLNQQDKAEEALLKAVEIEKGPLAAGAFTNLGLLYLSKNEYEKAAKYIRMAVELNPDLIEARINLANIYKNLGLNTMMEQELKEINLRLKTGSVLQEYNPKIMFKSKRDENEPKKAVLIK